MSIFYSTIQEMIDEVKNSDVSYRKLHNYIKIKGRNNEIIKVPYNSIISKYMNFLEPSISNVILTEGEQMKYYQKPKKLSLDLYGTTELWSAILEINHIYSIIDFKPHIVRLFKPTEFRELLNEIMIREKIVY